MFILKTDSSKKVDREILIELHKNKNRTINKLNKKRIV